MTTQTAVEIIERAKYELAPSGYRKHDVFMWKWDSNIWDFVQDDVLEEEYKVWYQAQIKHAEDLAAAGAQYLDENYPDWRDRVSPDTLDMSSGSQCVLGQYFGEYDAGIRKIWSQHFATEDDSDSQTAKKLGFLENGACYQALDLAWQAALRGEL